MVAFLMEELYSFTGYGWEQEDDITLLTLRCSSASNFRERPPSGHSGEQDLAPIGGIL